MTCEADRWRKFQALSADERCRVLSPPHRHGAGDRPFHVLYPLQFDRTELDRLCDLATAVRRIAKSKPGTDFLRDLLSHKLAMFYFMQPSTRTFLSFIAAAKRLGIHTEEVRDARISSEFKGEAPLDSARTFSSYFDLIVMRHPEEGFCDRVALMLEHTGRRIPVINAGSGPDQHPTQALLDIYTLIRSFESRGGIEGKHIAFVGDLLRGRTVRSCAALLKHYRPAKISFVAPSDLQIGKDILTMLDTDSPTQGGKVAYQLTDALEPLLPELDAVYMTRLQTEWDRDAQARKSGFERFHLRKESLRLLKPNAVILHPLPKLEEIAPEVDEDPRAMYWRQVRNGMWIRTALLCRIFRRDDEVMKYYEVNF